MKACVFLLAILILMSMGCHKGGIDQPDEKNQPGCRVTVIERSSGYPINCHYTSAGKIESIKTGSNVTNITYKGDSIFATAFINNGSFYQRRKYRINSDGLPSAIRVESDPSGAEWANYSYEYNGTEVRKMTATTSVANLSISVTYYWSHGNLDSTTDGLNTIKYDYYTDKTYRPGDANYLEALLNNAGIELFRTKNMRKSTRYSSSTGSGYSRHFNYEYDKDGKITAISDGNTTYELQYQCPQKVSL